MINSLHTQAIATPANNFRVVARSKDGVIESIERDNIIGVQWYPEHMLDYGFFEFFIGLCESK